MAENATDHLSEYFAQIPAQHKDGLATIRHWQNLRVAQDGDVIWIRGLSKEQVQSKELKWIPFLHCYTAKDNLLFRIGHLVPERRLPASLLWNPIERLMNISISNWNHNYFGIQEQVAVKIVPVEKDAEAFAVWSRIEVAAPYIYTALKIRLDHLAWVLLDGKALFLGIPVPGVPGVPFWKAGNHLLPVGYDFAFPVLKEVIADKIDQEREHWILWHTDSSYTLIPRASVKPLSISSFRLSTR